MIILIVVVNVCALKMHKFKFLAVLKRLRKGNFLHYIFEYKTQIYKLYKREYKPED